VNCEIQAASYEIVAPFPEGQLVRFWQWYEENRGAMMDDNSPKTLDALREKHRRDTLAGGLSYAIYQNGLPVGAVWGEHAGDDIYIGHLVFERDVLTSAEKFAATKDALGKMFQAGARKVAWMLYPENRAFNIFLLKLGATTEGYLRKGTRKQGAVHDLLLLASFPEDFS
jgi:RimJ/RimL family protein N-acetyltransferase